MACTIFCSEPFTGHEVLNTPIMKSYRIYWFQSMWVFHPLLVTATNKLEFQEKVETLFSHSVMKISTTA